MWTWFLSKKIYLNKGYNNPRSITHLSIDKTLPKWMNSLDIKLQKPNRLIEGHMNVNCKHCEGGQIIAYNKEKNGQGWGTLG
jgi:hypothetical protein